MSTFLGVSVVAHQPNRLGPSIAWNDLITKKSSVIRLQRAESMLKIAFWVSLDGMPFSRPHTGLGKRIIALIWILFLQPILASLFYYVRVSETIMFIRNNVLVQQIV